jgi:hypothetical protein
MLLVALTLSWDLFVHAKDFIAKAIRCRVRSGTEATDNIGERPRALLVPKPEPIMRPRLYNIAHTDEDAPSRIEARDAYGRRPMVPTGLRSA